MSYRPGLAAISAEELRFLDAPGNQDLREAWLDWLALLHGALAVHSATAPRPLFYAGEDTSAELTLRLKRFEDTPFYERMVLNTSAIDVVRRLEGAVGPGDRLSRVVDAYLDDVIDLYNELRALALTHRQEPEHEASASGWRRGGFAGPRAVRWMWISLSVGARDQVRPGEIVAMLATHADLAGEQVGVIDVHEDFTRVQVPAGMAGAIARALDGVRVRGRAVRVGQSRVAEEGGSAGRGLPRRPGGGRGGRSRGMGG